MVMRDISLYVFFSLLTAGVGSACVPVQCLTCNITGDTRADSCPLCSNNTALCINDMPPNCRKDFQVFVNSTGSNAEEGDDVTLTCVHNLTNLNLTFEWKKDKEEILKGQNKRELVLKQVLSHNAGQYTCCVNSPCGIYESSPHGVTVKSGGVLLLVVCGVSALALVVLMGLAMKFKLKRDSAKHKERMKQRAQAGQSSGPAPFTPRQS